MPRESLFFLCSRLTGETAGLGDAALGYSPQSFDWSLLIVRIPSGPGAPVAEGEAALEAAPQSAQPEAGAAQAGRPAEGKAAAKHTEAYLAFRSEALATLFNAGRHDATPVAAARLDRHIYTDFARHPVVLFESAHEIKRWLIDRAHYAYDKHLYRYAPERGLSRIVELSAEK